MSSRCARSFPTGRPRGFTATGCGWAGSRSTATERSARAAPGSSGPMPTIRPGLQFLSDEELRAKADEAARRGLQVAIHAIGDAANAQAIGTFEWLNQRYPGDRRWRIEHVQVVDPADIPRFARRDHRLDAAHSPDQRPADGRGASRAGPAGRRLCLAVDPEVRRKTGVRLRLSRSNRPTPSPACPPRSAVRTWTGSRRAAGFLPSD
jgi:hypothetical protein